MVSFCCYNCRLFCCWWWWCVVFFKFIITSNAISPNITIGWLLLLVCTSFDVDKEIWRNSHESICSSMEALTLFHYSKLNWMITMLTKRGISRAVAINWKRDEISISGFLNVRIVLAMSTRKHRCMRTRERQLALLAEKETRKQITIRIVRTESMKNWKYLGASLLISIWKIFSPWDRFFHRIGW